jgi:hypothetical protein
VQSILGMQVHVVKVNGKPAHSCVKVYLQVAGIPVLLVRRRG